MVQRHLPLFSILWVMSLVTENGGLLGSITTIIGGVDSGDGGLLGGLDGLN